MAPVDYGYLCIHVMMLAQSRTGKNFLPVFYVVVVCVFLSVLFFMKVAATLFEKCVYSCNLIVQNNQLKINTVNNLFIPLVCGIKTTDL